MNGQFETWLHGQFARWLEANGQRLPPSGLRITPPMADWETANLELGLRQELFALDEQNEMRSNLLDTDGPGAETRYPLFCSGPPPRLLRENLCQLAAAARLIYERGWLPRQIVLQPSQPKHRAAADGFELLVKTQPDRVLIWVETKRSMVELEKLIADLRACSRRGPHAWAECGFPQNHPRHEFALEARPEFLWAVAPDGDTSFALTYEKHAIALEALPSLPPRSLLELR